MTQDEIIEMARQAGFFVKDSEAYSPSVQEDHELTPYLETFAKLVAEAEREACAVICDEVSKDMSIGPLEKYRASWIAQAIRARGNK